MGLDPPYSGLPDRLGIGDLCNLIFRQRVLAQCGLERHGVAEQSVCGVADLSGVPRKVAAKRKARAAARV